MCRSVHVPDLNPVMAHAASTVALCVVPLASPLRLDLYLHQLFPHLSRRQIPELFASGDIIVNGRRAKKSERVSGKEDMVLGGQACRAVFASQLPANPHLSLTIAYQDTALFVVDKPAFTATLALRFDETDTLANALLARFPELVHVGGVRDAGLLQRLDRDTSGLVLGAHTQAIWQALQAQMQAGGIEKGYLALVAGEVKPTSGTIDWALSGRSKHSQRVTVNSQSHGSYVTAWRVDRRYCAYTLLDVTIRQGFRHQIRAHLAAMGHPIVGDRRYNGPVLPGLTRHFLHAHCLSFRHPVTARAVCIKSQLPADLRQPLSRIKEDL